MKFFTLGFMSQYVPVGIVVGLVCALYAFFRSAGLFRALGKDPKTFKSRLIRLAFAAVCLVFCVNIWAPSCILVLYLVLSGVIADILALIFHKLFKKKNTKFYLAGGLAAVIFAALLAHGIYGMNHIVETEYRVASKNIKNPYKIVFLSDTHYGSIQKPELLTKAIDDINALSPDIVVLGGDIVDERTSRDELNSVFKDFGRLNAKYGTYYVYGNHDNQPYVHDCPGGVRTFTDTELDNTITDNGITILSENYAAINGEILLVGRADYGWEVGNRAAAADIIVGAPENMMKVMLDHQPIETDENAALGFELQLSGHTHGGQLFPFSIMYQLMGMLNYGEYKIGDMTHITSSGFTGWGWPVRNAYYCEYVVVSVVPAE